MSCCFQDFLLAFGFCHLCNMSINLFIFIIFRACLASWTCRLTIFIKFEKFYGIISSNFSLLFHLTFQCSHYACGGTLNCVPHLSEFLFISIHFSSLFSSLYFSVHSLYWSLFKAANSFVRSNLLLNPSSVFFTVVIMLFYFIIFISSLL